MGRPRVKRAGLIDPDENWKSKDPRELAKEIATFMGGEWPEREPRKIQISLEEAPTSDEELFELTQLNPTLIWEMTQRTRHLFLEVSHAPPPTQPADARRYTHTPLAGAAEGLQCDSLENNSRQLSHHSHY